MKIEKIISYTYMSCKHHIYELVLEFSFEVCLATYTRSKPVGGLFKWYRQAWVNMGISKHYFGIHNQFVISNMGKYIDVFHLVTGKIVVQ